MLDEFYEQYYHLTPPIVEAMERNPRFLESVSWSMVTPMLNYYKLVLTRPDWETESGRNIPEPIRQYMEVLDSDMDKWLSRLELPKEFRSIPSEQ